MFIKIKYKPKSKFNFKSQKNNSIQTRSKPLGS